MLEPTNEQDLAAIIAGATGPLTVRGGGTHGVRSEGEVLSTAGLSGISLYDPGALTIVADAGTPLSELEAVLARENQQLSFEPMDHRGLLETFGTPTIGGVAAANISGPRRIQTGACRDSLIGVRFVDGRGTVVKNGGRVMKNVTGYDLVKLMAGSYGTLGAISEVAFKLLPRVETQATVRVHGLDTARAVQAMSCALATPYGVSGAAHLAVNEGGATTLLRLEGFAGSVRYRATKLVAALARFGETTVQDDPAKVLDTWQMLRDVRPFHGRDGDVWRLSVRPSDAPDLIARLGAVEVILDWGGGLIWALAETGTDLRAKLNVPGHATLIRASAATRTAIARFHPEIAPLAAISAGLRAKFDPRGILNPGLMG